MVARFEFTMTTIIRWSVEGAGEQQHNLVSLMPAASLLPSGADSTRTRLQRVTGSLIAGCDSIGHC